MCGTETAEVVIIPELEVTWGQPDSTHGSHTFTIYNDEIYECTVCGEGYYTWDQSIRHQEKMNEWIKANLGIDWLARNKERRRCKIDGHVEGRVIGWNISCLRCGHIGYYDRATNAIDWTTTPNERLVLEK